MRSSIQLVNLFLLPLAVSAGDSVSKEALVGFSPFKAFAPSTARVGASTLKLRQSTCLGGTCDGGCMDVGGTCCNDGNGYCQAGTYCTPDACCEIGSICSGSGGGSGGGSGSGSGSGTCDVSEAACDDGCMPLGNVCCNDGTGSCKAGYYCTATACCPIGKICDDSGSAVPSFSFTSSPTATSGGGDDFSFSGITALPTATTSDDDSSFTFGPATTNTEDDFTFTTPASTSSATRPTTANTGGQTAVPPPRPGAGAQLEPNAKFAAGVVGAVAGVAALLL